LFSVLNFIIILDEEESENFKFNLCLIKTFEIKKNLGGKSNSSSTELHFDIIFFRCKEANARQEATSRILVDIKAGVEHLSDKLQNLKAPKGQVPLAKLSQASDEYALDLLGKELQYTKHR